MIHKATRIVNYGKTHTIIVLSNQVKCGSNKLSKMIVHADLSAQLLRLLRSACVCMLCSVV